MQPPDERKQSQIQNQTLSSFRRWFTIGVLVLAVLIVGDVYQVLRLSKAQSAAQSSQDGQRTPLAVVTQRVQSAAGPAILGAAIGSFVARFGEPTLSGVGSYDFQNHMITVLTGTNQRSIGILENAPANHTWSASQARSVCLTMAPPDGRYVRQMTLLDTSDRPQALQFVYVSRALASEFPASHFLDENGDPTTRGTFGIILVYQPGSSTGFLSCAAQVGLELTLNAQTKKPGMAQPWAETIAHAPIF